MQLFSMLYAETVIQSGPSTSTPSYVSVEPSSRTKTPDIQANEASSPSKLSQRSIDMETPEPLAPSDTECLYAPISGAADSSNHGATYPPAYDDIPQVHYL